MSVKFFGQFLIEEGEIDDLQLREALERVRARHRTLGELAVDEGVLDEAAVQKINAEQRHCDRPFGQLALEMGLLARDTLERLLLRQREERLFVGQALVQLGHLSGARLPALLDCFKADQAAYTTGSVVVPAGLAATRMASVVLDLLPKLCMRVAQVRLKVGLGRRLVGPSVAAAHAASLVLRADPGLEVGLLADRAFGRRLAAATSGLEPADLDDELVRDGLGEFLNVLGGNVLAVLEKEGVRATLSPPRTDRAPDRGWGFEVVVTEGAAALVLAPVASEP